jgi:hypothetical protein
LVLARGGEIEPGKTVDLHRSFRSSEVTPIILHPGGVVDLPDPGEKDTHRLFPERIASPD